MAISTRPGPVLVESGGDAAGSGGAACPGDAVGLDMNDRPDLMQPDHQHSRDQPGDGDNRRAPP